MKTWNYQVARDTKASAVRPAGRETSGPFAVSAFGTPVEELESRRLLSAGSLDPAFGGGSVVAPFPYVATESVAVQKDGKVLVAGTRRAPDEDADALVVFRYNANGSLDASFGRGGKVVETFGTPVNAAADLAVQPDGKILLVGYASIPTGGYPVYQSDLGVIRLNPDGSPDRTFGSGGRKVIRFGKSTSGGTAIALQKDGRIVVGGFDDAGFFDVARLTPKGALDPSFGTGGKVRTSFGPTRSSLLTDLAVGPDGRIVAVGTTYDGGDYFADVLIRYLPDGKRDATFGSNGKVFDRRLAAGSTMAVSGSLFPPDAEGVAVLPNNKVLVATTAMEVRRFTSSGGYDTKFGVNGIGSIPGVTNYRVGGWRMALAADGKAYVTGYTTGVRPGGVAADLLTVRFLTNGHIDTTWGTGGEAQTDLGSDEAAYGVAVSPAGNVVVAGNTFGLYGDGTFNPVLVRYLAN